MDNVLKQQLEKIRRHARWLKGRAQTPDARPAVPASSREEAAPAPPEGPRWTRGAHGNEKAGTSGAASSERGSGPAPGARRGGRSRIPAGTGGVGPDALDAWRTGEFVTLDNAVPGREHAAGGNPFYRIRYTGSAVDETAAVETTALRRLTSWPVDVHPEVERPREERRREEGGGASGGASGGGGQRRIVPDAFDPSRVVFVDIETGGLSPNTYLFLCGMMFLEEGDLVMEQAFARTYAEEAGVMTYVRDTLDRFDAVVTYNGDTFDLPFIRTRLAVHRCAPRHEPASVDLIHAARRVFRGVLPDRRLLTVEKHLRGVERTGDIPGRLIPDAWHEFVRTQNADLMRNVLYHNRMDIFTMAVLLNRFASRPGAGF